MAIDKVVSASITDSSVTSAKVASGVLQPNFRNLLINGDMRVDQRDATTTVNSTSVAYNLDRFLGRGVGSAGVFTLEQDTTSPDNFTNSLKATVTTADSSPASGSSYRIQQMVEGNNIAHLNWGSSSARTVTLSFYVYSSVTGTFGGSIGNGNYDRFYVFSYTVSSANTWERKTISITGDTSGTWPTDTSLAIRVNWSLGAGSTYLASAGSWGSSAKEGVTGQTNLISTNSATFRITGTQLEVGSAASDFEFLPNDVNFARCQRYYFLHSNGNGDVGSMTSYYNASQLGGEIFFPCTMRTTPTLTATTGTDYYTNFRSGATDGFNEIVNGKSSSHQCSWYATGGVSGSAGDSGFYRNGNASAKVEFSAEL